MIQFDRIDIKNFNSIGLIENFSFEDGIHAVKGLNLDEERSKSNGSGKSSFFDAITWCLYGKTPNGKTADAIINRVYGKNCFVKLYFTVNDVEYRIERYRNHDDEDDNIKVFINDRDKTVHPPTKNQETIDEIIQVPFDLFTSSFVIAQGLNSRFTALTDFQRKETIENIRNNQVWDKSREINKKKLKEIEGEIEDRELEVAKKGEVAQSHQNNLREIKEEIKRLMKEKTELEESSDKSELQEELSSLEEELDELQGKIDSLSDEKAEVDDQLRTTNERLSSIPDKVEALRKQNSKYEDVLKLESLHEEEEELQEKLKILKDQLGIEEDRKALSQCKEELQDKKGELEEIESKQLDDKERFNSLKSKVSELDNKIESSQKKIEFYEHYLEEDHDAEECPTCGHTPGDDSEEKIRDKYNKELQSMLKLRTAREENIKDRNKLEEVLGDWEDEVVLKKEEITEKEDEITSLQKTIREKEQKTTRIEGQINSVEDKILLAQEELKELGIGEDELGKVRSLIQENSDEIEDLNSQRTKYKDQVSALEEEKEELTDSISKKEQVRKELIEEKEKVEDKVSDYDEKISSIETQLEVKKEDISKTAEKRKAVIEEKEKAISERKELEGDLPIYQNLDKIFSPKGIRAHIISKDIGFINKRLDFYSKHFFSDMYVQLDPGIDEEGNVSKIDIPVSTTMNFDKTYEDCSGGEKRRIDICIQLSIFDLILSISSVTTNLLVLDEVFEGLDSEGVKAVMDVIKTKAETGTCIYVISHLPNLGEHVEDEVVFVKQDGITQTSEQTEAVLV